MSEVKFTKGEWIVYGDWAIKRKGTTEILASFEERGFNNQEGFANAHLISAAPKMYQALERILENQALGSPLALSINNLLAEARGE